MKQCTSCELFKSLDKFPKDKRGKNGLRAQCRVCRNLKISERKELDHSPAVKMNAKLLQNWGRV